MRPRHLSALLCLTLLGAAVGGTLVASNPLGRPETLSVVVEGRGLAGDVSRELEVPAGGTVLEDFTLQLGKQLPPGRHVFAVRAAGADGDDGSDTFLVVDVEH